MSVDQCVGLCNHYPKPRARTFQYCKKLPRASLQSDVPLPAPPTRRTPVGSVLLDSCSRIRPARNPPVCAAYLVSLTLLVRIIVDQHLRPWQHGDFPQCGDTTVSQPCHGLMHILVSSARDYQEDSGYGRA